MIPTIATVNTIAQVGGGGLLGSFTDAIVIVASLMFVLMIVALAGFAYKSLSGDGITWPEDMEDDDDEGVTRGDPDDEWKYS